MQDEIFTIALNHGVKNTGYDVRSTMYDIRDRICGYCL